MGLDKSEGSRRLELRVARWRAHERAGELAGVMSRHESNAEYLERVDAKRAERLAAYAVALFNAKAKAQRDKRRAPKPRKYAFRDEEAREARKATKLARKAARIAAHQAKRPYPHDVAGLEYNHRGRARRGGGGGDISVYELADHRRTFGKACAYCELPAESTKRGNLTIDHVIPISKGGRHALRNIQYLCQPCNSSKGDRTMEEWIGV